MKPEEVPDQLVALLCNGNHIPGPAASAEDWARCILANALPTHEAMVRAKVAAEIEGEYQRQAANGLAIGPLMLAADIARSRR